MGEMKSVQLGKHFGPKLDIIDQLAGKDGPKTCMQLYKSVGMRKKGKVRQRRESTTFGYHWHCWSHNSCAGVWKRNGRKIEKMK